MISLEPMRRYFEERGLRLEISATTDHVLILDRAGDEVTRVSGEDILSAERRAGTPSDVLMQAVRRASKKCDACHERYRRNGIEGRHRNLRSGPTIHLTSIDKRSGQALCKETP